MQKRGWITPAIIWALITVLGELAIWRTWYLPETYAREGEISTEAFLLLMRLAVPVFSFVVAMLITSVVRYRSHGQPTEDGAPIRGNKRVYGAWLGVTSTLTLVLIINPGLTGLSAIRGSGDAQLVVQVEASRYVWKVDYPDNAVTVYDEMVLPVGKRIRIEVHSTDVLHSMWIPAFATKIDAVPGMTTVVHVTPERTGSLEDSPGLRIQCAELCGIDHATMRIPVRVVTADEFDEWLAAPAGAAVAEACGEPESVIDLVADHVAFDRHCLAVPDGEDFTVVLENREPVPHNFSVYADAEHTKLLFASEKVKGKTTVELTIPGMPEGQAYFLCDTHKIPAMAGVLEIGNGGDGE